MRRRGKKKKANPPLRGERSLSGGGQRTNHNLHPSVGEVGSPFQPRTRLADSGARPLGTGQKERSPPGARAPDTQRRGHGARTETEERGGEGGVKPVVHPVGKPRSPGRPRRGRCPPPSRVFKAEEATAAGAACAPGCTQEPAHRAQAGGSGGGSAGTSPQDRPGSRHAPGQRQQPSRSLRWEATERERVSTYLAVQTAFVTPKNDRRTRAGRIRVLPRGPSGRGPVGDTQPKAFSPCPGAPRDIWSTP